jgi:hypothetical protein
MKPISNQNFGNMSGKIKMTYHNGTAVVDGYIVKQTGTSRFVVAPLANSTVQSTVFLATTTAAANTLVAGQGTINGITLASNAVQHVAVLRGMTCVTTDGLTYAWDLGAPQGKGLGISTIV